jgi:TonB family protein
VRGLVVFAVAALWCGAASAQTTAEPEPAPPKAPVVTNPDWLRRPTGDDIGKVYPQKAQRDLMPGAATIKCDVTEIGTLDACSVLSEAPPGYDFGAAALKMANLFKMKPRTIDGLPVGGATVVIPINFRVMGQELAQVAILTKPNWRSAPSAAAVRAAYPAQAKGLAGKAVVRCGFDKDAHATDCKVRSQTPGGKGFGQAAKQLAESFVLWAPRTEANMLPLILADIPFSFTAANGPEEPPPPPRWTLTLTPTAADQLFPAAARAAKLETGVGVVDCGITNEGRLADCRVAREDPAGLGFGEAALKAAGAIAMNPWTEDGRPMEGHRVAVPIRLKLQTEAPPPAAAP